MTTDPFTNEQLARRRERDRELRIHSLPIGHGRRVDGSYGRREVDLHDAFGVEDGIPIRSIAFYVAAVLVVWGIAAVVPWLGFTVPWWIAYILIPGLVAKVLTHFTAPSVPLPVDHGYIAQVEHEMDVEAGVAVAGPEGEPR